MKILKLSLLMITVMLSGCGKDGTVTTQTSLHTSDSGGAGNSNRPALVVYGANENPVYNQFQATNLAAGLFTYDFTFTPDQDESLVLNVNTIHQTLLGCDNSDVGSQVTLLLADSSGVVDLSASFGLGSSPVSVKQGQAYVVRVNLVLHKNCLGIAYRYGVELAAPQFQR